MFNDVPGLAAAELDALAAVCITDNLWTCVTHEGSHYMPSGQPPCDGWSALAWNAAPALLAAARRVAALEERIKAEIADFRRFHVRSPEQGADSEDVLVAGIIDDLETAVLRVLDRAAIAEPSDG